MHTCGMSVDALKQVFGDDSPLTPGVQAICVALAWRTPPGGDSTLPISYRQMARLTCYSSRSIPRLILEAISVGAIEIVWARPGEPARYRINRGEWHVPLDHEAVAAALEQLAADAGEQQSFDDETLRTQRRGGTHTARGVYAQSVGGVRTERAHQDKDKDLKDVDGAPPMLVDRIVPDPAYVARWDRSE